MTITVCMIVKNEERVLARCLDSLNGLYEELIIVDTGSTDATKEIAHQYTDKVYDFEWINDFSAARNFAFSKASMEYIYSADADEVLDNDNREQFLILKNNLLPEIEIVQMKYGNQLQHGTVYNFDEEYRPKLFKRIRKFVWIEPVHEIVRTDPVVFDSDIIITHLPESNHSDRDFGIFERVLQKNGELSDRLFDMYARELYLSGKDKDFLNAEKYFSVREEKGAEQELHKEICLILSKCARLRGDINKFFKYATKLISYGGFSESCNELGYHYESIGDLNEAYLWFYNAAFETSPLLKLSSNKEEPLKKLIEISAKLGNSELCEFYKHQLEER